MPERTDDGAAAASHEIPPPDDTTEAFTSVTVATDPEVESGIRIVKDAVRLATRHAVARAALRAGIRILVEDPNRIVELLRERGKLPLTAPGRGDPR
jgi:hypothetical protein